VQFYQRGDGGKEDAAIRRLMTAILVDAVHCYEVGARCGWKNAEASEARFWIFGHNIPIFRFPSATYLANLAFLGRVSRSDCCWMRSELSQAAGPGLSRARQYSCWRYGHSAGGRTIVHRDRSRDRDLR
jgi:hypothetical protein